MRAGLGVGTALLVVLAASACSRFKSVPKPPTDAELPTALKLPAGLTVAYWAHLPAARWLALGPDGSVYVATSRNGTIVRYFAINQNGMPDSQTVVASKLKEPHGMAFHKGFFYVANTDGVVRFALDARGVPTGAPTYVNHYGFGEGH
jgi:glucose/arabinose dehydrogenase